MTATVIPGVYNVNGTSVNWPSVVGAGPFDGYALVPNTQSTVQTFTGAAISGGGAPGDFSFDATQFPVTVPAGQTAIIKVRFAPTAAGFRTSFMNITTGSAYTPQVYLIGIQAVGVTPGTAFPYTQFPNTKVGLSTTLANVQINNTSNGPITVSNIAFTTGTDFFLVGAPVPPFVILQSGSSIVFSVQFTPSVAGNRIDTLNITTSGAGGVVVQTTFQGNGTVLQSAFNLTGATQGSLFSFPGSGSPLILLSDPNDLNTEEDGSFVKLHDYQIPNLEKQTMRVRGHYEDLGPASLIITAKSRRVNQPDEISSTTVPIGLTGDKWIREFVGEVEVTGELVQLTFSRSKSTFSKIAGDNFNRPDEIPLVNPPWIQTPPLLPLQLLSNVVSPNNTQSAAEMISLYDGGIAWPSNQYSRGVITAGDFLSGNLAVLVRANPIVGGCSGYMGFVDFSQLPNSGLGPGNSNRIALQDTSGLNRVDGPPGGIPFFAGDTLEIQAIDNRISLLHNGVEVLFIIDNTYASGKPGLGIFRAGATAPSSLAWDNWEGGGTGDGGPISILDYYPEFEPKGEVIGGT